MTDAALQTRDLTRVYGKGETAVRALDGVTLEVPRGEMVAIMGPSGSGKSTLLHLLGALDTPTSGEIQVGGRRYDGLGDAELTRLRRERIGFVFQFFNLLPALTAEENVLLPALIAGRRDQHPRVRQRFELTAKLIEPHAAGIARVETEGESRTERLLWAVMLGDLLSLHLAALRRVDPSEIEVIERLKDELGPP